MRAPYCSFIWISKDHAKKNDDANKYRSKKLETFALVPDSYENMNQKSRMCLRWSSLLIAHHAAGTMPRRKSNNNTTPPVMQRRRFSSCNSFLLLGNKGDFSSWDFSSLSSHSASKSRLWYEDRTLPMITSQYCAMNNYSNQWPHYIQGQNDAYSMLSGESKSKIWETKWS